MQNDLTNNTCKHKKNAFCSQLRHYMHAIVVLLFLDFGHTTIRRLLLGFLICISYYTLKVT